MKTCSFYHIQYVGNMDKTHCANEGTAAAHFTVSFTFTHAKEGRLRENVPQKPKTWLVQK